MQVGQITKDVHSLYLISKFKNINKTELPRSNNHTERTLRNVTSRQIETQRNSRNANKNVKT
jgi:hypothetical protein